jgi:hypothetical protein
MFFQWPFRPFDSHGSFVRENENLWCDDHEGVASDNKGLMQQKNPVNSV